MGSPTHGKEWLAQGLQSRCISLHIIETIAEKAVNARILKFFDPYRILANLDIPEIPNLYTNIAVINVRKTTKLRTL